jgi:beta-galactosidase
VLEREHPDLTLNFSVPPEGLTLDILVENMGRVNYGPVMAFERKGITHGVLFGLQFLYDWEIYPLPLDDLSALTFCPGKAEAPAFFRGHFEVSGPLDTFLALPGWSKGVAWINGFNLGRYWARGPQQTLYIPAPLLRSGQNELVILELEQVVCPVVELRDYPTLG